MSDPTSQFIPLSQPFLHGKEWDYIKTCLDTGWVSSAGSFVGEFEQAVAAYTGASYAIAVNSGTSALHLSLLSAGVEAGDLVLVPNLSFVATPNAVRYVGAEPIFVDVHPDTWQMDVSMVEQFLGERSFVRGNACIHKETGKAIKAIIPVHALGYLAEMKSLLAIADQFHLTIIEDAAEALGSWCRDQHAGTMGTLGCLSFNGNKIITTGGGGMILTHSEELAKRVKHLSTQAKSHPQLYEHDEVGYNYRLNNVQAAMGLAQMEQLPLILQKKKRIAERYKSELPLIQFPHLLPDSTPNHWLPTLYSPKAQALGAFLANHHIQTRPLWTPLNRLPMYRACQYLTEQDHAGRIFEGSLSLPAFPDLGEEKQDRIIGLIQKFLRQEKR